MEEWLKAAAANPYFILMGIIGGLFSIIALPLAIYIFYKQRRDKLPRFSVVSNNLVQNLSSKVERVTVLFDDVKVSNLTISKIYFWNAGRETILKEDIAQSDPIQIISGSAEILDARVIHVKRRACNFELNIKSSPANYQLTFDFMDYWDAAVIQVIHTGQSDEDICLQGTIKGANRIRHYKGSSIKRTVWASVCMFVILGALVGITDLTESLVAGALCAFVVFLLEIFLIRYFLKNENWLVHRGFLNRKEDE